MVTWRALVKIHDGSGHFYKRGEKTRTLCICVTLSYRSYFILHHHYFQRNRNLRNYELISLEHEIGEQYEPKRRASAGVRKKAQLGTNFLTHRIPKKYA